MAYKVFICEICDEPIRGRPTKLKVVEADAYDGCRYAWRARIHSQCFQEMKAYVKDRREKTIAELGKG